MNDNQTAKTVEVSVFADYDSTVGVEQGPSNIYPDAYFAENKIDGGGIYCLYCPVRMDNEIIRNVRESIARFDGVMHFYSDSDGFALTVQRSSEQQAAFFGQIAAALEPHGLKAGISGPFASDWLARGGVEKAREAALIDGRYSVPPLHFASELRWKMFSQNAEKSIQANGYLVEDFFVHALKRVLEYDALNNSQYFMSMYQYLLSGKSLKLAAEEMGVHRNTLDYRINRIAELFSIDFNNRHTCFELLFSCKLFEGMELGTGTEPERAAAFVFKAETPPPAPNAVYSASSDQNRLWLALVRPDAEPPMVTAQLDTSPCAFRLLYIDSSDLDEKQWGVLYTDISAIPSIAVAFDDRSIAVLYSDADCPRGLSELAERNKVQAALSKPIGGSRLSQQIALLRLTLNAGRRLYPGKSLYLFDELNSFVFFLAAQRDMRLSGYLSEEVLRILYYDYERNTELSRSLYVYLFYFMDLKEAAMDLNIHRNTLDYQIKKITQILGELPGTGKRFEMMCTYGMLAMSEED